MAEKKKTEKPANLESFKDLEGTKPKSDTARVQEEKKTALVKIKALRTIRSFYGALDEGNFYELPEDFATILCADGRAERCS